MTDRTISGEHPPAMPHTWSGIPNALLGMWFFVASEIMFFTGLLGACLVLRAASAEWQTAPDLLSMPLALIASGLLLLSSFLISRAVIADQARDAQRTRIWTTMSLGAGILFVALIAWEIRALTAGGFSMRSSLFASSFLLLIAVHTFHVLAGIAAMIGCVLKPQRINVGAVALYWHFAGVVWFTLFVSFYIS